MQAMSDIFNDFRTFRSEVSSINNFVSPSVGRSVGWNVCKIFKMARIITSMLLSVSIDLFLFSLPKICPILSYYLSAPRSDGPIDA